MDNPRSNPKIKRLIFAIVVIGIILSAFILTSLMPNFSLAGSGFGFDWGNGWGGGGNGGNLPTLPIIPAEGNGGGNCSSFEIFGVTQTPYIRTNVGETYDGGNWTISSGTQSSLYSGDYLTQNLTVFTNVSYGSVIIKGVWDGFIPALYYSNRIDLAQNNTTYYYPKLYIFNVPNKSNQSYIDQYTHYGFNESLLNSKSVNTQISATYLDVPTDLESTLKSIIDKINFSQVSSDYGKIVLIRDYLKANYVYDKNYTHAPAGQDPVQWFLQTERRGVCSNFNSAFVLLLRSIGIPSRLVTGFSINASAEYQNVTCDQAHAWAEVAFNDLGWIEFDATASSNGSNPVPNPIPKQPTQTSITGSSSKAVRSGFFNTQGIVTDSNGNPVSGLTVTITLKTNKNDSMGYVCGQGNTDANGVFNVTCPIPMNVTLGSYQVIASIPGNDVYAASDSDPPLQVNAGTEIEVIPIGAPFVGQPFSIYAQLLENDTKTPIQNKTLTLSYIINGEQKKAIATTNETGYAFLSFETIPQTANNKLNYLVYFNQTGNYEYSEKVDQLNIVTSSPEIVLPPADPATIGQPYNFTVQLIENATGKPIANARLGLNYTIGGQIMQLFAITNATGFATFFFPSFPQIPGNKLDFTVFLNQADPSMSTEANGQLDINPASQSSFFNSPFFYAIIIAAAALSTGILCFFIYKKRKSHLITPSLVIPAAVPIKVVETINTNNEMLKIIFPLITQPFPDVWGVGELFHVEVHSKKNDSPINGTIELQFGDEPFKKIDIQNDGVAKIDFQTDKKGIHVLTAKYSQPGCPEIIVKRSIKIVDYTEEIVNIYKETFDLEKSKGIPIGIETSPREFQAALLQNFNFEKKSSLDSFVEIFEIADYSLYNLGRTDYEKMYLSALSVKEAA